MAVRHFRDDITWWEVTGDNGYGGFKFAAPKLLKGRWEDRPENFINPNGDEVTSNAMVYLDREVSVEDYLVRGDHTDTDDPMKLFNTNRPWQARQVRRTTNLRNVTTEYKVFL